MTIEEKIRIALSVEGTKTAQAATMKLSRALNNLGNSFNQIKTKLNKLRLENNLLKQSLAMVEAQYKRFVTSLNKENIKLTNQLANANKKLKNLALQSKLAAQKVNETSKSFDDAALSVLFFGMEIQRVFTGIAKSAVMQFNKIIESNERQISSLQKLSYWWDYLKFSIGSALNNALAPLLPMITKVINLIAQWAQQHPKLTAALILSGVALGTILKYLAFLKLGLDGLLPFLGKDGKVVGGFRGLMDYFAGLTLTELVTGGILAFLGLAAYEADLGDVQTTVKDFWDTIKTTATNLKDDLLDIFGDVWDITISFLSGDSEALIENLKKLFIIDLPKLLGNLAAGLVRAGYIFATGALKMLNDFGLSVGIMINDLLLQPMIDAIKKLGKLLEKSDIPILSGMGKSMQETADMFSKKFEERAAEHQWLVDKAAEIMNMPLERGKEDSMLSEYNLDGAKTGKQEIIVKVQGTATTKEMMDEISNKILEKIYQNKGPTLTSTR